MAYNHEAIYFAVKCYDKMDSVSQVFTSRDDLSPNADVFSIYLDTYNDNQNGFYFGVTSQGVQLDAKINPMDFNGWWKQWVVPGNINLASKVVASSFQSNIRLQDGWYAFKADYSFSPVSVFKQHGIDIIANSQTELNTLYNSIVTVSDVFLAFKELSKKIKLNLCG